MPDDRLYDLWVCVCEEIAEGGGLAEGTPIAERYSEIHERYDDLSGLGFDGIHYYY